GRHQQADRPLLCGLCAGPPGSAPLMPGRVQARGRRAPRRGEYTRAEERTPMTTAELTRLTLREQSDLLHRRAISPVELTETYLARIEASNATLNAYYTVTAEAARAQAREAETELAAGADRGPLHGIPVGLKDLIATAGVRTTAGSRILADWVPTEDATIVRRLRAAGVVFLGKCAMTEFAMGHPHNPHYGPTRNPWDLDRTP